MHAVTTVSLPAILTDGRAHKSMTEAHCLQHSHKSQTGRLGKKQPSKNECRAIKGATGKSLVKLKCARRLAKGVPACQYSFSHSWVKNGQISLPYLLTGLEYLGSSLWQISANLCVKIVDFICPNCKKVRGSSASAALFCCLLVLCLCPVWLMCASQCEPHMQ